MISVIVPVYNAGLYLRKCVESILSQTYPNFELILVDDGSYDDSLQICKAYQHKDERIKVFSKDNGGPSEARNYGVQQSTGGYISFIDADDIVHPDYLKVLINLVKQENCDISAVKLKIVKENVVINKKIHGKIKRFNNVEAVKNMLYQKDFDTSPCALLVKRSIIEQNPFPIGKFHEDDYTVYKYFLNANVICLFTGVLYYYVQRESGIMNSTGKVSYDEIDASNHLTKVFEGMNDELYKAAISKKFSNYCQLILKNNVFNQGDYETYNELITYVKSVKWSIIMNSECRLKNRIAAISLIFGVRGLRFLSRIKRK